MDTVRGVSEGGGWWKGRGGVDVPLDVFGVGAEVGCVVDFVLEELYNAVSEIRLYGKLKKLGGGHTIPVTLFPMKFAG